MGKKFTVYLLIAALVSANFSRLFVYAGFELNRNYIAAKLCENLDKPWLHCNGKCYFIKKLKQAEEKEKANERQAQKNLFQDAMFFQKPGTRFFSRIMRVMLLPAHGTALPVVYLPIFRPPQLG